MLDLLVLNIGASDKVTIRRHIFVLDMLNAPFLVAEFDIDNLFLCVLEDDGVQFDDGVGFWHTGAVAFVGA